MTELVNSSNDVIDLINNLHFSIINYETVHRSFAYENYVQFYNDKMKNDEIENKMFFIDRRYQNHKSNYRDRNRSYIKSRNAFFRKLFKFSFQRQKKCFVCEKIDCWSINHIQQKRNDSIKKFENQKFHFWIKFDFNKKIQLWIIEYKNENENKTIYFFDNLIINFETYNVNFDWFEKIKSNSFNSHQFFILYESFENFESLIIIEQFVKNFLIHQINKRDEIIASISFTSYVFNTITKSRYDFFEFKKFFIDSKTAAKSNANIDQFETLQRIDNSIKINHNTTKSINFIFEMNTISSINSINFNTFIKLIIFFIIIENIFFYYV